MAVVTMRQLLESGVHFGHQTRRWNPKMKRFIMTERNGIYIIDLQQSLTYINNAYEFVKETVAHGGTILFVGTKKQAQEPIAEQATRVGMPYVNHRWLGGMLTNFQTISKRLTRLKELEEINFDDVAGSSFTKKELLILKRERDKLEKTLGGIRSMTKVPSAVWIVDTKKEHLAVDEARKLGLPVIAILDTNCDPDEVDYKIPGNDDAIRSVTLLTRVVADAVAEGLVRARPAAPAPRPASRSRWPSGSASSTPRPLLPQSPLRPPRLLPPRPSRPEAVPATAEAAEALQSDAAEQAPLEPPVDQAAETPAEQAARAAEQPPAEQADARRRPSRPEPGCRTGDSRFHVPLTKRANQSMANYTAADIKALREQTGAGMLDVKKALDEAEGDRAKAVEILRVKGLKGVTKREGRSASNGLVAAQADDGVGTLVEVNCETDFVAKGEKFIALADQVLAQAVASQATDAEALLSSTLEDGKTVQELLDESNAIIGEKIEVRRVARLEGEHGRRLPPQDQPRPARPDRRPHRGRGRRRDRGPRRRDAHRRVQPLGADPRGGPGRDGRERASRRRGDRQGGGQAGGRPAEDRRGPRQRLLQGERPARAAVRQGAEEDRREGARGGWRQGHWLRALPRRPVRS